MDKIRHGFKDSIEKGGGAEIFEPKMYILGSIMHNRRVVFVLGGERGVVLTDEFRLLIITKTLR